MTLYLTYLLQLSKAGSFRRFHRSLRAYFNILSLASVLMTLKPSSNSMMESTLKPPEEMGCDILKTPEKITTGLYQSSMAQVIVPNKISKTHMTNWLPRSFHGAAPHRLESSVNISMIIPAPARAGHFTDSRLKIVKSHNSYLAPNGSSKDALLIFVTFCGYFVFMCKSKLTFSGV